MFEAETRLTILQRIKGYYDEFKKNDVSAVEGTFSFDTFAANAKEFEKTYAEMDLIMQAAFPQTSWGKYLDYLADELAGLSRREATRAIVTLTISGTAGVTVPAGSLFATENGINFTLDKDAVIDSKGKAEAKATAQASGAGGNVPAETINKIPVSIYGVSSVVNTNAAYNGYEEENDGSLLERLLFAVRQPATSGNVYHYVEWSTAVPGVGAVRVLPLWNGNGTVKVIVVDANKDRPSEDLLQSVRDAIAKEAPIGATVTVAAPELTMINISLQVTNGIGNVKAIKSALSKYFKENVFGTDYTKQGNETVIVSYAQVGRIILDNASTTGVNDYENLLINNDTKNIITTAEQLPTVGTVTLT